MAVDEGGRRMLYGGYQAQSDLAELVKAWARDLGGLLEPYLGLEATAAGGLRECRDAACSPTMGLTHERPPFRHQPRSTTGNRIASVREEVVTATPFGTLLRFAKDTDAKQPKVLVVAPLSGHFATLLRGTVQTLLRDHDVYITDWHNARDVPLSAGRFGFDDYVEHVIRFIEAIGPGTHVLAVCQPCVQVLAAAAIMAADDHPAQPLSMTLMAGPVDTRINPTEVNASRELQAARRGSRAA